MIRILNKPKDVNLPTDVRVTFILNDNGNAWRVLPVSAKLIKDNNFNKPIL